jgi:hypothetical protein
VQKNRGGTQGKSQYLLECTEKTTMAVNINCRKKRYHDFACLKRWENCEQKKFFLQLFSQS